MKNNKVVLAFSGGLDTSYCAIYLSKEKNLEVYAAFANTGGFTDQDLDKIKIKAESLGVKHYVTLNKKQEYYDNIIKYLIFGNVLKNNTYPLSVSAERVYQAIALAEYAKSIGASYIAHGSTGAGNDQIRFDLIFGLLAPEIQILTPIREQKLSRKEEIKYLIEHGIDMDWEKSKYSVNKGLWGTSVGGEETLTSEKALPESAYPSQLVASIPSRIRLCFKSGELCGIDDQLMTPIECIEKLENIASKYAIGRDIHTGDTIIGIKGRVGFEAAAASIIIKAHHSLEKHILSKWQLHWKEQLGSWYGMFIHEAQYFDPVMRNIESFLRDSQTNIIGTVYVELHPYRFTIEGINSEFDKMNYGGNEYGETNNNFTSDDVIGFTNILKNSMSQFTSEVPK
ncbi:MAG: argininosuccinate synthase domain-containing protein [Candidatus Kapaibacterium sp.]